MTARKTKAAKAYDYVAALHSIAEGPGKPTHAAEYRRVLRKLVRESVMESWRTTIDAEGTATESGRLQDNVTADADRIAKALVP